MLKFAPLILSVPFIFFASCNTQYKAQSLQYKDYRITPSEEKDPSMTAVLKPYSDSVNKSMNDIIGYSDDVLDKKAPSGTLGNFMVDAFYVMSNDKYKTKVDVALLNFGGIRLPQLAAGAVTRGKVYEMMPFDNMLIIQRISGAVLQQLLDLVAAKGGWPVAGMMMQIKNNKAVNIMIGGKPLDPAAMYTVANSDFVANGGDNADMLRDVPQQSIGYLMRDAIFDYINMLKSKGQNIKADKEIRITNAE
jgi:2',3'-cyclic-nucleotide 2'-phosphodiesterase (5'-nucleotidase family)